MLRFAQHDGGRRPRVRLRPKAALGLPTFWRGPPGTQGNAPQGRPPDTQGNAPQEHPPSTQANAPEGRPLGTQANAPEGRPPNTQANAPEGRAPGTEGNAPEGRVRIAQRFIAGATAPTAGPSRRDG